MRIKEIIKKNYAGYNEKTDETIYNYTHVMMQNLHKTMGVDWLSPYIEIEHNGKFTIKSLNKELAAHGYTPDNSLILVLMQGPEFWNSDEWLVTRIYDNDFDVSMPYILASFCRKYDFNDARKKDTCNAIFFAQKKEYLTPCEWRKNSWGGYFHDLSKIKKPDYHGRFKDVSNIYNLYRPTLDHSGYIVSFYRDELQERVEKYKAEKAKNAYLQTDNKDKITVLERLIDEYKKKVSEEVLTISTAEDALKMSRLLDFSGLYDIIRTFNTFKDKTINKTYASIKASNNDYDAVAKKCYEYLG